MAGQIHQIGGEGQARSTGSRARPLAAVILAAGKGTRMGSDLPKVLHEVAGRPMLHWVVDAIRQAGAEKIVVVIGHGADSVRALFTGDDDDLVFVVQDRQLGTGHATRCAQPALRDFDGDVLVVAGDGPLLSPQTVRALRAAQQRSGAAGTLATTVIDDPTGYGRIVRDEQGRFRDIVEHRSATPAQRSLREVYPSYACFDRALLFEFLERLAPDERSGEYYLTRVPAMMRESGHRVEIVDGVAPEEALSINTPQELSLVERILRKRMEVRS